jgi:hypothetical protein
VRNFVFMQFLDAINNLVEKFARLFLWDMTIGHNVIKHFTEKIPSGTEANARLRSQVASLAQRTPATQSVNNKNYV